MHRPGIKIFRWLALGLLLTTTLAIPVTFAVDAEEVEGVGELLRALLKAYSVGQDEIQALARLGTVGEITARLEHYTPEARRAIYLAIALERKVLAPAEADEWLRVLGKVDGFDRVAKRLCDGGAGGVKGAVYELRVANSFARQGVKAVELRRPFYDDPLKRITDIDLILKSPSGQEWAVECKSYGNVSSDVVQADADTLLHFVLQNPKVRPLFSFAAEPSSLTQKLLASKGIIVLHGEAEAQVQALQLLDGAQ